MFGFGESAAAVGSSSLGPGIRYRPLEIAALRSSGARVFILVAGNMRGSEIADVFVLALRTICRILLTHQGPFIGRVGKRGQIKLDPQPPLDSVPTWKQIAAPETARRHPAPRERYNSITALEGAPVMKYWYWFWMINFAVAGTAFVVIAAIVTVRGVRDLREMFSPPAPTEARRRASYQIPNNFHQAKPTVLQIAGLASDTTNPTLHHFFRLT